MAKRRIATVTVALLIIGGLAGSMTTLKATANWARKYNAECTTCHTMYPQLNATGYKFRQLGYRFPGEAPEKLKPKAVPSHAVAAPQPLSGLPAQGAQVYEKYHCSICHSITGIGGRVGPPLDEVGAKRTPEWLREHFENPPAVVLGSPMPPVKASPEEVTALVSYMTSLQKPAKREEEVVRKPTKFDFAEGASFRYRPKFNVQKRPGDVTRTDFNSTDVTFFYDGPATEHLSYFFEANLLEDGGAGAIEVGDFQYNWGGDEVFGYTRVGQFHVIGRVGQGILDRPVTISTPLILSSAINGFRFATNGRGVEGTYSYKGTTLRTYYLNSLAFEAEDRELPDNGADPIGLGRQNQSRSPSFALVGERVFPGTISGFTGAYLHFRAPTLPGTRGKFVGDTVLPATGTVDRTIDRLVFGGNYLRPNKGGMPNFHLLAGVGLGFDTRMSGDKLVVADPTLQSQRQRSYGFFGEFDKYLTERLVAAVRFDYFRPDTLATKNINRQMVVAVIGDIHNHMRLAGEYRFLRVYPSTATSELKTDNRFQAEFQFNF